LEIGGLEIVAEVSRPRFKQPLVRAAVMLSCGPAEILRFPQNDGMGSSEPIPHSVTLRNRRVSRAVVGEGGGYTLARLHEARFGSLGYKIV
jgi:hypothetical protein